MKQYNGRQGSWPERSLRSIQSRWDKIKQEAGKFAGYMAAAIRDNASGTSDADKTTIAACLYAGVEGHKFPFMHCWELLKDEPKLQDVKHKGSKTTATDAFGEHIPPGSNTIDLDADEPSPAATGKEANWKGCSKSSQEELSLWINIIFGIRFKVAGPITAKDDNVARRKFKESGPV